MSSDAKNSRISFPTGAAPLTAMRVASRPIACFSLGEDELRREVVLHAELRRHRLATHRVRARLSTDRHRPLAIRFFARFASTELARDARVKFLPDARHGEEERRTHSFKFFGTFSIDSAK